MDLPLTRAPNATKTATTISFIFEIQIQTGLFNITLSLDI